MANKIYIASRHNSTAKELERAIREMKGVIVTGSSQTGRLSVIPKGLSIAFLGPHIPRSILAEYHRLTQEQERARKKTPETPFYCLNNWNEEPVAVEIKAKKKSWKMTLLDRLNQSKGRHE